MERNPVVSCSALRRRGRSKKNSEVSLFDESYISDDIIIDILRRLSTKIVLRCRFVCRRWRNLTSTSDFTQLHIPSCFPMFLKNDPGHNLLVSFCETSFTKLKFHGVYEPYQEGLVLSHNGLIVAYRDLGYSDFIIYNPIYSDVVNISLGVNSIVLGVFFHPVLKEYCILCQIIVPLKPSDSAREVQYKILNLESTPIWRHIKTPYTQHVMNHTMLPELIGNYIYWMVVPYQQEGWHQHACNSDIMQYDTRNEEFKIIPCPISVVNVHNVNMMDIDGVVSLVHVRTSKILTIWTLKDVGDKLWTRSNYIFSLDVYREFGLRAITFWNGELILKSDRRLYACNLKSTTCRKFWPECAEYIGLWPHKTSIVSLRNCKSEICMVEEDENSQ